MFVVLQFDELQALDGFLDDFRVFALCRSDHDIMHTMHALDCTAHINCDALNLWFTFDDIDEAAGVVPDASGNGHHGLYGKLPTITNVMTFVTKVRARVCRLSADFDLSRLSNPLLECAESEPVTHNAAAHRQHRACGICCVHAHFRQL